VALEAHARHPARGPQLGPRRRGARGEQEIEAVPHRQRHDRVVSSGREAKIRVEQVEFRARIAPLHHVSHFSWEQREAALDQAPAARLVAGQPLLLEEHDLEPLARELQRGRRPAGARAHHCDIEHHDL